MRKIISILLIFMFVLQNIQGVIVLINFYSNQSYIAQNICENRFEKIPICKGQCYLKKEIKKTEKNQHQTSNQKLKEIQFYILNTTQIVINLTKDLPVKNNVIKYRNKVINHQFDFSIFHPPQNV